eukprot:7319515-Pyramimonas_sp.AAC.1
MGVVALCSVYLEVNVGLKGQNLDILNKLREHQARHGLPWAMGGDMNMDPGELASFAGFRAPGIQLHAPPNPTCHGSGETHNTS